MAPDRFPLRAVAIASALAIHALSAAAQAQPATPQTLETIKVEASADASAEGLSKPFAGGEVARGSRIGVLGAQDMMDTPFNTTTYTQQLIANQQAQSIGDVLLNDASVRSARGFGNFQQAYFIRGFPVFSDDVSYNGLFGLVPRQYMAAEFVERVEVFRGANAFLSGAGAGSVGGGGIGGLINVLPKRAPNEPLSEVSVGVQSGGQGYVAADIARRFGPDQATGIRLNAARRDGGDDGVDGEKHQLSALSLGLDWHSSNVRLSADIGYQNDKLKSPRPSVTPASNLPIPEAPDAKNNFAQPWTYSNSRDVFGTVRGEVDLSSNVTAWAAVGTRHSTEDNSLTPVSIIDALGDTSGYRFDNARKDKVNTGEIGIRGKFQTGGIGHTVVASAAALSSDSRNAYALSGFSGIDSNIYRPTAVFAPAATIFTGGVLSNPGLTESIDTSSFAVADTMSFAQDTVLLTVGARRQKIKDTTYDYNKGSRLDGYDQSKTTPVVGFVFKPMKSLSLYANYIEGLIKGDVAPATTSAGQRVTNAGQVFAPYVSKQKEIGAKYDGGNIGASVALFRTSKPSAYLQNGTYGSYGEQRNRGLELSVFGEPTKGLRLLGGVTFLDAEQRRSAIASNNGNDVIGVPKHQINLGAEWDVPGINGFSVDARVLQTGKQYADAANTQVLPSWTRLDLGARYLMDIGNGRLLTIRGRVDNVLNKSYWASAGGYPGANYLVLGQPRTFVLTGTVNF
jgi:iron complex outermembrane receptor protein